MGCKYPSAAFVSVTCSQMPQIIDPKSTLELIKDNTEGTFQDFLLMALRLDLIESVSYELQSHKSHFKKYYLVTIAFKDFNLESQKLY